ncbi:MAG: alpha/beta hydrolase [Syntrophorhabdales bacterium]
MGVHLERHGRGEKILFIHGAGGSSASWYFQKRLEGRCEVILVDLPGHGRSKGEAFRTIDGYVGSVAEAIEENGLEGCYLAGHSMGGAIAMSLALASPGLSRGLILIATGARLKVFPPILEGILQNKEETVRSITGLAFSKKAPPALIEAGFAEMMAAPKEVIHADFSGCDHYDLMGRVGSIALPTIIITGADDLLTPQRYAEYLAREIGGSRLVVIPDAGHMVMLEKPDETNRVIEAFLSR